VRADLSGFRPIVRENVVVNADATARADLKLELPRPDEHARRWFRRYWTFGVGSGAHILVNGLLDVTRELA
jgi:hypothetical protein